MDLNLFSGHRIFTLCQYRHSRTSYQVVQRQYSVIGTIEAFLKIFQNRALMLHNCTRHFQGLRKTLGFYVLSAEQTSPL